MCTVSFIPVKDQVYITSNRDEKLVRKKAFIPALIAHRGSKIICPKDADAGGTWIAMKENGDAIVLLNGAFICHTAEPPYRESRGVILLDIFSNERPSVAFTKIDLHDIEPFTIVLFEANCLYEFRWDGAEKFCRQLSANRPHIWSSATLYDGLVIKKREQWFAKFLNESPLATQKDILNFHQFSGDGDSSNDLIMTREGLYTTVSVTGIQLNNDRGSMYYIDVLNKKTTDIKIELLRFSHTSE
jgi:Transport and Golgi organisation 2